MKKMEKVFGKHYLVEFVGCNPEIIKYIKDVKEIVLKAVQKSEATMLGENFHQFDPFGVSGYIFIQESHFSIHTWPEDQYAAFDILTCGDMYPDRAIKELSGGFQATKVDLRVFKRGF